jgi:hypothetical protein
MSGLGEVQDKCLKINFRLGPNSPRNRPGEVLKC